MSRRNEKRAALSARGILLAFAGVLSGLIAGRLVVTARRSPLRAGLLLSVLVAASLAAVIGGFAIAAPAGGPPPPSITSGPCSPSPAGCSTSSTSATFTYKEEVGANVSMGPQAMEGDLKASTGDWLSVGWHFSYTSNHPASTVYWQNTSFTFAVSCVDGSTPTQSQFVIPAADASYAVAANDKSNTPTSGQQTAASYQAAVQLPALCGSKAKNIHLNKGGTFASLLSSTDTADKISIQWHYVDANQSGKSGNINCSSPTQNPDGGLSVCTGGWSGTSSVVPGIAASAVSFQCKLDTGGFSGCGSGSSTGSTTYPGPLPSGSHTFQVEATVGTSTSTATSYSWTVTGKSSPTLSLTGPGNPGSGTAGTAVAASSITATLAGGNSPTGSISFTVFGPQASAPTTCTSGGTTFGSPVTVSGNTAYHPSAGFTPTQAGNYWLYASYGGDGSNNPAPSACPPGSAQKIIVGQALPQLTVSAPGNLAAGGTITNTQVSATLSTSSGTNDTNTITFVVFGPQATAPTSCGGVGWTTFGSVTPAGNSTYNPTSGSFTPDTAGTYWWYVSSPADANNSAAASLCNSNSMTHTIVAAPSQSLTISGNAVGTIYPGGVARPIAVTFTNPNGASVEVTSLTVSLDTSPANFPPGCAASDFQITQSNITSANRFTVPGGGVPTTIPSSGPVSRPTVRMKDNGNQTTCAGATIKFLYSST